MFTFHAYRSWLPDHKRGYVQRGKGILSRDPEMAENYGRRANFDRVRFSIEDCQTLLQTADDECRRPSRRWRLHLGVGVFNHLHLIVSWENYADAKRAKAVFHRALTVCLRDAHDAPLGQPFLARGGSVKRVRDRAHFDYLCKVYLPSHRKYGGILFEPAKSE